MNQKGILFSSKFNLIKSTLEAEEPEEEPDLEPEEQSVYDDPCRNSTEINDINQINKNTHQNTFLNSSPHHQFLQKKYKEDNFNIDSFNFDLNVINKEPNKFQTNENYIDTNITTSCETSNKLVRQPFLIKEKLTNKNNDKFNNSQSDTNNCFNKNNNFNSSFSLSDSSFNNKNANLSFSSTKNCNIKKNSIKNKKLTISLKKTNDFFKNNYRYLLEDDKILTPIEEKITGFNFYSIVSQKYNENQMKLDDGKDDLNNNLIDNMFRKSLEPKYNKNFFMNKNKSKNFMKKNNIKKKLINEDIYSDCISEKKDTRNYESDSYSNNNLYYNKNKINTTVEPFDLNLMENEFNNSCFNNRSSLSSRKNQKINKLNRILKNTKIDLDEFKQDEISIKELKYYFRTIEFKSKNISIKKNQYLKTLIEIQNFYIDDKSTAVWVFKISVDFKYIAFGFKDGLIKIYSIMGNNFDEYENIYNKNNITNYFKFIREAPHAILHSHIADIVDLSWSSFNQKLLLSASLDHFVILWKILDESINENNNNYLVLYKYKHNDIVTSISFNPTNPYIFVSGCFDRFIRIYKIKKEFLNEIENNNSDNNKLENSDNDVLEYFNIQEIITSVSFFPDGRKLAIGTHNGKIYIYTIFPDLSYNFSFFCRNRLGKFSNGRKITSIEFIDKNNAIITTADSRIRCVSMLDGTMKVKYKGHMNNNSMIRCNVDFLGDMIISGSEDGCCYIWSLINKENFKVKNYHYEYFKPFSHDIVYCSQIAPEFCMINYSKKIYKITNKINIISVIINCTDKGRCEIILNVE